MNMKLAAKVLAKVGVIGFVGFAATFTIYFFNLDMKATALLEPLLEKWYDRLERKQYI